MGLTGASAAALLGCGGDGKAGEDTNGELETTRIRISGWDGSGFCAAPMYVARQFLAQEGFTDIQYPVVPPGEFVDWLEDGKLDIDSNFVGILVAEVDTGARVDVLGGLHAACFELFARDDISSIGDFRRKKIGVALGSNPGSSDLAYMTAVLGAIGIQAKDTIVSYPLEELPGHLAAGNIHGILTIPPTGEQLRDAGVSRVLLSSMSDPPWSQYNCCMVAGNKKFVRKNPVATKRALRAIVNAAEFCSRDPEGAAQYLLDTLDPKLIPDPTFFVKTMKVLNYEVWRTLDPEDSLRFYALKLKEAGLVKITPDEFVEKTANWRFINELKQEMAYSPPRERGRWTG